MAVQLLGGEAKGFTLEVPPETITRPTAVLLKRRLFDWRQDWRGWSFADLCAGSGSMGFEALSRGAEEVWLNESHRQAFRVLEKNVIRWRERYGGDNLQLSQLDFVAAVERLRARLPADGENCVLFFDPPYEDHRAYERFWETVRGFAGEVWVESDEQKGVSLASQRQHLSASVKEVVQGSRWMLVGRPLPR